LSMRKEEGANAQVRGRKGLQLAKERGVTKGDRDLERPTNFCQGREAHARSPFPQGKTMILKGGSYSSTKKGRKLRIPNRPVAGQAGSLKKSRMSQAQFTDGGYHKAVHPQNSKADRSLQSFRPHECRSLSRGKSSLGEMCLALSGCGQSLEQDVIYG